MPVEAEGAVQQGDGRQSRLEDVLGKQLVQDLLEQNQAVQAEIQRLAAGVESGTATGTQRQAHGPRLVKMSRGHQEKVLLELWQGLHLKELEYQMDLRENTRRSIELGYLQELR